MQTATALEKEPKIMLAACVDPELIKRIDNIRGRVPRSRVIEEVMTRFVTAMENRDKE
jgi:hypothetical protein